LGELAQHNKAHMDRVIQSRQRAGITQVLTPVFDPHFSESSFGFRPGRSVHQAVRTVLKDIREGYGYAVDIDLEKFFDTVDHDVLMGRVSRRISDKRILRLIGKYLRAGVVIDGRLNRTVKVVPQGGPLSPMRIVQGVSRKVGACFHTNTVDSDSLSGQGPMISANRPVRPCMPGGVGRDG
jgi:retron-type reverse transcriptase